MSCLVHLLLLFLTGGSSRIRLKRTHTPATVTTAPPTSDELLPSASVWLYHLNGSGEKKKLVYTHTRIVLIPFEKWLIENGFYLKRHLLMCYFFFVLYRLQLWPKNALSTIRQKTSRSEPTPPCWSVPMLWVDRLFFLFFFIRFLSDGVQWWPSREFVRSPTQLRSVKKDWRTLPFSFFSPCRSPPEWTMLLALGQCPTAPETFNLA